MFICNLYHLSLPCFFPFISRYMPQKCQLLWQQGSHPHDALSLSRGPRRFPAGCAVGRLLHEGQSEETPTSRTSSSFSVLHATYCLKTGESNMPPIPPPSHRVIYVRASATCRWETPWRPVAAFRRFWSWSPATERPSRRWDHLNFYSLYFLCMYHATPTPLSLLWC